MYPLIQLNLLHCSAEKHSPLLKNKNLVKNENLLTNSGDKLKMLKATLKIKEFVKNG